jgi:DNA-binding GntR family transcriptional regulator
MDQVISALTAGEPVYRRVRTLIVADIVSGHWAPGSHVTLARLCARYGISHVPIREALQHLQGEGMVELRSHRGVVIPALDRGFIDRHYDVRGALQAMLTRRCAEAATAGDIARLATAQAAYREATEARDVAAIVRLNADFHGLTYAIAGNPLAADMADGQSRLRAGLFYGFRARVGYGEAALARFSADHDAILDCVARHDGAGAHEIAWQHMMAAKDDLLARLDAAGALAA